MEINKMNIFWVIIILVFAVPLVFGILGAFNHSSNDQYLAQNGINGTVEVLDAKQTGNWHGNNPEIEFTFLVTVPGRSPYQVDYTTVVTQLDLSSIHKGATFPVLVDPNDPQNVRPVGDIF